MPFEVDASTEPRCSSSSILPLLERARRRPQVQCVVTFAFDVATEMSPITSSIRTVPLLDLQRTALRRPCDADAAVRGRDVDPKSRAAREARRRRSPRRFQRPGISKPSTSPPARRARRGGCRARGPRAASRRLRARDLAHVDLDVVAVLADHARAPVRVVDAERAAARRRAAAASPGAPRARARARPRRSERRSPPKPLPGRRRSQSPRVLVGGVVAGHLVEPPSSSRQERCCSRRTSWSCRRMRQRRQRC